MQGYVDRYAEVIGQAKAQDRVHLEIMWTIGNVFKFSQMTGEVDQINTKEFCSKAFDVLFKNIGSMQPAQFKRVISMLEGRDAEKTGFVLKFLETLQSGAYDIKRLDFA